jgi:L-rhamnose mutarotase
MTAFNIVRMRVKPGRDADYLEHHRNIDPERIQRMTEAGLRRVVIVKTGERSYCFVGEWDNFDGIVQARPEMIAQLDQMRDILEVLDEGIGVTDPVSGEAVLDIEVGSGRSA